jgi:hypothetical protein
MPGRRFLIELLVSVLLIQWVGAFSHCLRLGALGIDLAICSSSKAGPAEGDPRKPAERMSPVCPVCSALPAVETPEPPMVSRMVVWTPLPVISPDTSLRPRPAARAPPPPARAPPIPA